ncbi:MAG TPA: branched-chain amino acid ABC transporter permease [Candidatus Binatia bacterium]|nr:branched-chain amino acid ABC transporter permease [Candidatus Binatia bacterium]
MSALVYWLRRNAIGLIILAAQWPLGALLSRSLNPYYLQIVVYIGINIILAVSLNLINGIAGQFSLGHAGFMAVGAYVSAAATMLVWPHAPAALGLPVVLLVGGLAAALAGLLIGIPTLRLRGDYLAIATLGFGEIIRVVILNTEAVGGARGLFGIPTLASFASVYACALLCVGLLWRLVHSAHGKALLAIREDEIAAAAMGIDTTRYKIIAFVVGAFWAGVAGGLFAHFIGYIHTNSFTFLKSIEIVVMVVLGGTGSISGAVLAAAALTVLPELLRFGAEYRMIIYSLLLIIMMLTRPAGLLGRSEITPWRFWKSRTAHSASAG